MISTVYSYKTHWDYLTNTGVVILTGGTKCSVCLMLEKNPSVIWIQSQYVQVPHGVKYLRGFNFFALCEFLMLPINDPVESVS